MARLEQLIEGVQDEQLRRAIEAEIAALKERTRFGLVYERHLPEMTLIADPDLVEVGSLVRPKEGVDKEVNYRVVAFTVKNKARLVADGNGNEIEAAVGDLFVVKPFGESIYPSLTPVDVVERNSERPHHAVINGENFHALQLLAYLYEGQVDCIYIDPPYNTGARDWKYNNRYVDAADSYRHSKWLSMMEKRLRTARRLLKPDGVLIVTIDENEVHHLGVLLEDIFPTYLRHVVTIVISAQGNAKVNFSRVDEYAIFCVPDIGTDVIQGAPVEFLPAPGDLTAEEDDEDSEPGTDHYVMKQTDEAEFVVENARRRGTESLRENRPKMFFPIYIDEEERRVVSAGPPLDVDQEPEMTPVHGLRPVWPIDANGDHRRWRWGYETMLRLIEAGEIQVGKYNKQRDSWTINRVQPKKQAETAGLKKLKTVWRNTSHAAGTHGSGLLAKFLGRGVSFSFPKSVYATRDCLAAVCRNRPDALIVDFFGGSGTTLHSTLLMNAADGGQRRCILITNNEVDVKTTARLRRKGFFRGDVEFEAEGIFEAVARPRVKAAITGIRPDGRTVLGSYLDGTPFAEGFEENAAFFRLDYMNPDAVELGAAFNAIHPLLWLAAGAHGSCPEPLAVDSEDFFVSQRGRYAVLFSVAALHDLEQQLSGRDDMRA